MKLSVSLNKFALRSGLTYFLATKIRKLIYKRNYFDEVPTSDALDKILSHADVGNSTFFVIGSGPSVLDLEIQDWDEVRKGFSVGLNDFIFHDFRCNLYSIEHFVNSRFTELIVSEIVRRQRGPILLKPPMRSTRKQDLRRRISNAGVEVLTIPVVPSHASNPKDFHTELELFDGYKRRWHKHHATLDLATSAFRVAQLGINLGFKKICFIGVDLSLRGYFWEGSPLDSRISQAREAHSTTSNFRKISGHTSTVAQEFPNSLRVFEEFHSYLSLNSPETQLLVWSAKSGLSKFCSIYKVVPKSG